MKDNKNINNNFDEVKKISISKLLITVIMLIIVVLGGTFAWFTYQSRKTALVLNIGELNNSRVVIKPYQINDTMVPVNIYTSGVNSQISVFNENNFDVTVKFYYKINQLDSTLINNGLKYTIVSSSTLDGNYIEVKTGDFTSLGDEDKIDIFDAEVLANTNLYYRVYLWLDNNAGDQSLIQNLSIDIELNAVIIVPEITVNFDANGGTLLNDSKVVFADSNYGDLPIPTAPSGYRFAGWNTQSDGTGTYVTRDSLLSVYVEHTLYAIFTINNYSITYNANGGSGTMAVTSCTVGSSCTLSSNSFVRTNYRFTGWNTVIDGSGTSYPNSYVFNNFNLTNNITLYAQWELTRSVPVFTYTGNYEIVDNSDNVITNVSTYVGDWKIRFLTGGTFTSQQDLVIDAFLVGGGGGGATTSMYNGGGGGGGGYTTTGTATILKDQPYEIYVGNGGATETDGEATTAFDLVANGGKGATGNEGAAGGSGGGSGGYSTTYVGRQGGSDGADGVTGKSSGGTGQHVTTREFGETSGTLYAGGGGGGSGMNANTGSYGSGGASSPGGGASGSGSANANTGGGGGGGASGYAGGSGGSGIVVIRENKPGTVSYISNLFGNVVKGSTNGLNVSYNDNTSYLTLNGTPTESRQISTIGMYNFVPGEQYMLRLTYVSGTFSSSGNYSLALDVKRDANLTSLSERNYVETMTLPESGSSIHYLTISETGANEGRVLSSQLSLNSSNAITFNNYVVKIEIVKVVEKDIHYGSNYMFPNNLIKDGYKFVGWNTASDGSGTYITEQTLFTVDSPHQLYAIWTANLLYLFTPNNQHTFITGGWINTGFDCFDDTNQKNTSVGTTLKAKLENKTYGSSIIGTANAIDLTNYSTLHFTGNVNGGARIGVSSTKSVCGGGYELVHQSYYGELSGTYTIDISSATGNFYVYFASLGSQTVTYPSITVSEVWLS